MDAEGVDWAEVRRAYELSGETVAAIRRRFGLTRYGLIRRRILEGWTVRAPVARPSPLPRRKAAGIDVLELKLNRLVVIGMAMLEKRLAEEGLTEATARALTELCRAEELRMRSARQKTAKTRETKNNDAAHDFRDDPAWLDAELDRRLARLLENEQVEDGARDGGSGGKAGLSGGLAK